MAILSEYEEEDPKPTTKPTPSSSSSAVSKLFNEALDPSEPLKFLEKALEFVARETSLFKPDSVVKDVNALVRKVKDKVDGEERALREKKASEERALKGNGKAAKVVEEKPVTVAPSTAAKEVKKEPEAEKSSPRGSFCPLKPNVLFLPFILTVFDSMYV